MNAENPGPTADTPDERVEELMVRYWDGALDERGVADLNAVLAARPEWRSAFNDLAFQVQALGERGAARRAALPPRPPWRRRVTAWGAAAAAVLLLALLAAWLVRPWATSPDAADAAAARLVNAVGTVVVGDGPGEGAPLAAHQALAAGLVISTVGVQSSAEVICRDGTRLIDHFHHLAHGALPPGRPRDVVGVGQDVRAGVGHGDGQAAAS